MYFTQDLNTALNGLLRLTLIGWHFEVQPAGIGMISGLSELLSNNQALTLIQMCSKGIK